MSKPGGKPIRSRRAFVNNDVVKVELDIDDNKHIRGFYLTDNRTKVTTQYLVTENEVLKAWVVVESVLDGLCAIPGKKALLKFVTAGQRLKRKK